MDLHQTPITVKGVSLLFFLLILSMGAAQARANCFSLYSQKRYAQAAHCFRQEALKLGPVSQLGEVKKLKKGRTIRNAMLCLEKALATTQNATKISQFVDMASELFALYRKEKLYEDKEQLKRLAKMLQDFRRKLGYGQVTIVNNHPSARSCLSGNHFSQCKIAPVWSPRLRPGHYLLTVTYPFNPPVQKRLNFRLKRFQKRTFVVNPPIKKNGGLAIITNHPKAEIRLSGEKLNAEKVHRGSFWVLTLPVGTYTVVVRYPEGKTLTKMTTLISGKSKTLSFEPPPPPVLFVSSEPTGAQIYIDGKYIGRTPLKQKMLRGTYTIQLRAGCYLTSSKKIELKESKDYRIKIVLQRDPVYLSWLLKKSHLGSQKTLGWTAVVTGVIIGGISGVAYGLATANHNEAENYRPRNFEKYQESASTGNIFRTVGHVGAGISVLSLGFGIVELSTAHLPTEEQLHCQNRIYGGLTAR